MSGKEKGVQAIVKASCPLAVYVHCSAHVLNLVLVLSRNTFSIFCYCRTIVFYATIDKIRITRTMGQTLLDDLCLIYIHSDISISTGAMIKKFAATSRKIKL